MKVVKSILLGLSLILAWTQVSAEGLNWSGDFRYRYENVDDKSKDPSERVRHRVRARLKAKVKVNDRVDAVFRLATGGDGITDANQTLGDFGDNKAIGLDMAYLKYSSSDYFKFLLGKMKNPLHRGDSDLIFDGDWTPGGLAFNYKRELEHLSFFVNGAYLQIDERKSSEDDAFLNSAQLGFKIPLSKTELTFGYGHHDFTHLKGWKKSTSKSGNSVDDSGDYANEYKLQQIFASYGFKSMNLPIQVFAEMVTNTEADEDNKGSIYGFKVGKAKAKGTWQLKAAYKELEKDAVLDALTDGDTFSGTDGKGAVLGLKYACSDSSSLGFTYYDVKRNVSDTNYDFKKAHINYVVKF